MTIALRRAAKADSSLLFQWVNREDSLAGKLRTQAPIGLHEHEQWFARRVADPDTLLWIVELQDKPIGQLRLVKQERAYEVDIYIEELARRSGAAKAALRLSVAELKKAYKGRHIVRAVVKNANFPSQRLFEQAGFTLSARHADHVVYELTSL